MAFYPFRPGDPQGPGSESFNPYTQGDAEKVSESIKSDIAAEATADAAHRTAENAGITEITDENLTQRFPSLFRNE